MLFGGKICVTTDIEHEKEHSKGLHLSDSCKKPQGMMALDVVQSWFLATSNLSKWDEADAKPSDSRSFKCTPQGKSRIIELMFAEAAKGRR